MRLHTSTLREAAEQRFPVWHGNRREDRYAWWHAATLPHGAGRKRLDMQAPGEKHRLPGLGWEEPEAVASVRAAVREEPVKLAPGSSSCPVA